MVQDKHNNNDSNYLSTYIDNIISNLKNIDNKYFFSSGILILNNNICSSLQSQFQSTQSLFFDKNLYPIPNHDPSIVYCNPLHIILLLAYCNLKICSQVISILLFEYNLLPPGYQISIENKNELLFYSYIFGASTEDLNILFFAIKSNISLMSPFIDKIFNKSSNKTSDGTFDETSDDIPDIFSIKYNIIENQDIINKIDISDLNLPIIENNIETILNEVGRNTDLSKSKIINSFKKCLKICFENEFVNEFNEKYISNLLGQSQFNLKIFPRAHFGSKIRLTDKIFFYNFDSIENYINTLSNFRDFNALYIKSITKSIINSLNKNSTFDNEKIKTFINSSSPIALYYYYNQI